VLSGGEPLYRPDIFDLASYATQRGIRGALATNGTLVTKGM
jgi:MoaA/NifB/PqqE/SkfB family radical SAM enzyme